jgi:hypothetical protein
MKTKGAVPNISFGELPGAGRCGSSRSRQVGRGTAALRDFNPPFVGSGSIARITALQRQ